MNQITPTPTTDLLEKARISAGAGRFEETLEACRAVLGQEPLDPDALTLFTMAAAHLDRGEEVVDLAASLVAMQPNHPELHRMAGNLMVSSHQAKLAVPYLRTAVDLDPANPSRHADAARAMLAVGLRGEATGHARYAAALGATDPNLASLVAGGHPAQSSKPEPDAPLRVVVVTAQPDPREAKLGRAIRAAGGVPILLSAEAANFDAGAIFEEVLRFGSSWEAVQTARKLNADLIHMCVQMNYETALAFVSHRPAPVVMDTYDLLTGMWTEAFFAKFPQFETARQLERFCLEQADGLCHRNLQAQVLKRDFAFKSPASSIFWPEYCWDDRAPARKLSADDGKLHVAYSGAIHPQDMPQDWLARILDSFGVHFHVYPMGGPPDAEGFRERFSTYVELEKELEHFHLYQPVSQEEWLSALSTYDVMIQVLTFLFEGREGEHYTRDKLRLTYANKWSDCVDCDVFFLTHDVMFLSRLAERTGTGSRVTMEEINDGRFWEGLRQRALGGEFDWSRQRAHLSIESQAKRLMEFYRATINKDIPQRRLTQS